MGRKIRKVLGYMLISYSLYNGLTAFINNNALSQIKDIGSEQFPLGTLLAVNGVILLLGIMLIYFSTERKSDRSRSEKENQG